MAAGDVRPGEQAAQQVRKATFGADVIASVARGQARRRADSRLVPAPRLDRNDGFYAARWRRPEAYLDPWVRVGTSGLACLPADQVLPGIERLAADIASGAWQRHHELFGLDVYDAGCPPLGALSSRVHGHSRRGVRIRPNAHCALGASLDIWSQGPDAITQASLRRAPPAVEPSRSNPAWRCTQVATHGTRAGRCR